MLRAASSPGQAQPGQRLPPFYRFVLVMLLALAGCTVRARNSTHTAQIVDKTAVLIADFSPPPGYEPEFGLYAIGYTVVAYNSGGHLYLVQAGLRQSSSSTPKITAPTRAGAATGKKPCRPASTSYDWPPPKAPVTSPSPTTPNQPSNLCLLCHKPSLVRPTAHDSPNYKATTAVASVAFTSFTAFLTALYLLHGPVTAVQLWLVLFSSLAIGLIGGLALRGLIDMFSIRYPQIQHLDFRQDVLRLDVPVCILDGAAELPARHDLARKNRWSENSHNHQEQPPPQIGSNTKIIS
jgi:hypothetical protein